jgi:hypothetical protein
METRLKKIFKCCYKHHLLSQRSTHPFR